MNNISVEIGAVDWNFTKFFNDKRKDLTNLVQSKVFKVSEL